ncbi:hypothetical protein [Streptomyces lavendulae]|uniref:hypothetical protein n=1 Tax=Streptomyces lavendulae TaxID=1914 RepID=UPI003818A1B8
MIIVEAGDSPARSGVWSAEAVRLVGPAPAPVAERMMGSPHTADEGSLPIHIAVRLGGEALYLGTAKVSRAGTADGVLTDCELRFEAPLRRQLLNRVRPPLPALDLPGLEWLSNVNGDRAAALEQFITGWYPGTGTDATEPPATSSSSCLPAGLRQLYQLAKQWPGALGAQNGILPELDLHADHLGEMLVFGVENQGGFFWSLLWTLDGPEADPTVWFREFDEEPTLRPFWPWVPTRFYVAPGLVVHVSSEDGEAFDVRAGASHRSALAPLADLPVDRIRFDG